MSSYHRPSARSPPQALGSSPWHYADRNGQQSCAAGGSTSRPIEISTLDLLELSDVLESPDFQRQAVTYLRSMDCPGECRGIADGNALALWQTHSDEDTLPRLRESGCDHSPHYIPVPNPSLSSSFHSSMLHPIPQTPRSSLASADSLFRNRTGESGTAVPLLAPIPLPYTSPTFLEFDLPEDDEDLSFPPYTHSRRHRKRRRDDPQSSPEDMLLPLTPPKKRKGFVEPTIVSDSLWAPNDPSCLAAHDFNFANYYAICSAKDLMQCV